MGVQAALQGPIPDKTAPIGFRPEHLHELTPAGDELAQALGVVGGQRPGRRAHGFGEARDDLGVQRSVLARMPSRGRNRGSGGG